MPPPARLLDLTRLMSRLGKGQPTGVDRVEAAYLAELLVRPDIVFGLIRSKAGYLLLDRAGMARFQTMVETQAPLPAPDMLSRLLRRGDPPLAAAETAARGLATARCLPIRLPALLRRHLPAGFTYLNTGHAHLGARSLAANRAGGAGKCVVLIHDTIPLDHPEYSRPDRIENFRAKLAATAAGADLVIHSAQCTRQQTEAHFARFGRVPPGLTAPLGLAPPPPVGAPDRSTPYFVTLGTIEPRKNHAFLLDLWDQLYRTLPASDMPHLLIIGRRGWSNAPVFARLDNLGPLRDFVFELADMPDAEVTTLLAHARALLFPSFVEGYGLPPLEAAQLGTAVIVPPLPIYRETMGNYPVYAALKDSYSWLETIIRLKDGTTAQEQSGTGHADMVKQAATAPRWSDHFNLVLNSV
ncbi:glycosyltransferase family 1 protein [Pseudorhodobacter sp. E13]|uniref:glycosyltransferase n=1 Tax=Pseudorhodobacter sp. E13 TaxID=2487931 RepID=UPI000F8EB364|nr:glycosyltransferase [Pseudorhodobacter sp. E13]RUS60112.1 glycosyltransferase family 1 protein [Pseudorhodobacter sp. E13]